ncbi:MAG: ROK family protein [Victivallaceae bacterium]|nr:ROK family protein [Victivallaceae bacterium]
MKTLGHPKFLKKVNNSAILNLLRDTGPLSRTEIVARTKLGWGTITKYTEELVKQGMLTENKKILKTKGRNSIMLDLNPDIKYFIGIDWGSRSTSITLVDIKRKCVRKKCAETNSGLSDPISGLTELIRGIIDEKCKDKIAGIGIGVSGFIDFSTGEIIKAINFPALRQVPLCELLHKKFKVPVFISNSVNARLLGEIKFGMGVGVRSMIYLWLGTGVGSAVVSNGKVLMPQAQECLGDIGHILINKNGPLCKCGLRGCLEAYTGYEKIMAELNARKHDKDEILRTAAEYISRGLFYMIQLYAPEKIVIAGKYMEFGEAFLAMVKKAIADKLPRERFDTRNICFSGTGPYGGAMGAVELVWLNLYGEGGAHVSELVQA